MSEQPKYSLWTRFNTCFLMLITPEIRLIRSHQKAAYRGGPTMPNPTMIPTQFVDLEGERVRYAHSKGPEGAPTILLLNPLPQSILAYAPIWKSLTKFYTVYAYDLPGFGRSSGGAEWMTFEKQGHFLSRFIEVMGMQPPHVVGPDIGMPAALHCAINSPNQIESLIVGDGPGVAPSANASLTERLVNSGFWRTIFSLAGSGALVQAGTKLGCVNYFPNRVEVDDYVASYRGRVKAVTQWFKNYPKNLPTVDPRLAEIEHSTLIFWGDLDQILLVGNAYRLHEKMKNSKLNVFKDCGHFAYQDKHEEFLEMLNSWVNGGYKS